MNNQILNSKFQLIIVLLSIIILLTGCSGVSIKHRGAEHVDGHKIQIVTTIFPLYEFASEVAGDKADVYLLLPPGVEPHAYEPTPQDVIRILNADIFLYIGEAMEPWAHDILQGSNFKGVAIEASSLVDLIKTEEEHYEDENHHDEEHEGEHEHGDYDPHVWLDFENDIKIIDGLLPYLIAINPTKYFEINSKDYKNKLRELDKEFETTLENCTDKTFITGGHNAYSYLEKRYNLKFYPAHSGFSPNSEPTPKRVKEISDIAKKYNVKYIFTEKLMDADLAEAISEEVGIDILIFDPFGNVSKEDFDRGVSFIDLMKQNLKTLQKTMNCENI